MEPAIPYFTFRTTPLENTFLMHIYIDGVQFPKIHLEIGETDVSILTSKYDGQCLAKIRFPVTIEKSMSEITCEDMDHLSLRRYHILLRNCNMPTANNSIQNLDVITKYLSWNQDVSEEPDLIYDSKKEFEDEISASLEKLTMKNEISDLSEETHSTVELYGFANRYQNKLIHSKGNWCSVIDCKNPDSTDSRTRYCAKWENERQSFDIEHYLADYFFDKADCIPDTTSSLIQCICYTPYWQNSKFPDEKILTPNQMTILAGLPLKNFKLSTAERIQVLHSLFDIILACAYDNRINGGTFNSESAWNINKLSSTLSWLQVFAHPRDVIISFYKRSLTFPLMRHWLLSKKVLKDAITIFNLGRRQLLNCLVMIYELFDEDEDRRILNELYIEDYLIWIQQVHPQTIRNYGKLIESCKRVVKKDVFSTLPCIESAAVELLHEDESQYQEWRCNLNKVKSLIYNHSSYCGDSSTSESESSSLDPESSSSESDSSSSESESSSSVSESS